MATKLPLCCHTIESFQQKNIQDDIFLHRPDWISLFCSIVWTSIFNFYSKLHPKVQPLNWNQVKLSFGIQHFGIWKTQAINGCYILLLHLIQVQSNISSSNSISKKNWKNGKRFLKMKTETETKALIWWSHIVPKFVCCVCRVPGNFSFYNVKNKIILSSIFSNLLS